MSVSFSLRQGSITSQEIMRVGTLTWSYMIRGATFYEECIQWNGTRWYETVWNNTLQYCIVSEVSPIWDAFLTYCNHSTLCAVSLICPNNCDWILYCHSTHFVCSASSARISLDPTISTCCFHLVNLGPELKGARPGSVQCSWCLRRSSPHWPHCTHLYTSVHICTHLYIVTDVAGCCQRSIHLHKASLSWTLKDMLRHTKFSAVKYLGVDQPVILRLSPIARLLFNPLDDPVLEYQALTSLKLLLPLSHIVCGTSR